MRKIRPDLNVNSAGGTNSTNTINDTPRIGTGDNKENKPGLPVDWFLRALQALSSPREEVDPYSDASGAYIS